MLTRNLNSIRVNKVEPLYWRLALSLKDMGIRS